MSFLFLESVLCAGCVQQWWESTDSWSALCAAGENLQLCTTDQHGAYRHPYHPASRLLGQGLRQPHQGWAKKPLTWLYKVCKNVWICLTVAVWFHTNTVLALCTCTVLVFCFQIRPTKNQCWLSKGASLQFVWMERCLECLRTHTAAVLPSKCCMEEAASGTVATAGLTRRCRWPTEAFYTHSLFLS